MIYTLVGIVCFFVGVVFGVVWVCEELKEI